ncbi:hypothetical protein H0Z60_04655 [Ectothiorhodospiraceae bacterium WFHF3C12]|nr:hypothetical protein [Ectothiorhodospiraceae bacterium WFHF3C12]
MGKLLCWKCGASLADVPRPITRHSNCPECYAELHCCRMCRKLDSRYTSGCSDERTDPPEDKGRANFCEYYSPSPEAFSAADAAEAARAKARLDALFGEGADDGDGESEPAESEGGFDSETERARKELEKLFGGGSKS